MNNRFVFIAACVFALASVPRPAALGGTEPGADSAMAGVISRANLHYTDPAPRPEEGMPVGNGRVGTLVWTTASALHCQINRTDVYASGSATTSFPERNSEYASGVGFVDVSFGEPILVPPAFEQRLDIYRGVMEVRGAGVTARALAWHTRDVIAIEIDDRRPHPGPITVSLRMLRFAAQPLDGELEKRTEARIVAVRHLEHLAASQLHVLAHSVGLTQEFTEGAFVNRTALVAGVAGRAARAEIAHESEVRLVVSAGRGRFAVLLGSAASFDRGEDVLASAVGVVKDAGAAGFPRLLSDNAAWWRAFWDRGFIDLASADGEADYVETGYHYFLYLMASSSRGRFPPKFNGMLWNTGGDMRAWGTEHWFANLSCYYEAIPASNRVELLDPMFDMYGGAYESWARAAREQWGSQGIYIPETAFFDGLAPLPRDIAAEMRDLYLLRKPWAERSSRFMDYATARLPFSSRWNWIRAGRWDQARWTIEERGAGPFGAVTHILGTTAKVAYLFWQRYEHTLDVDFLRTRAYPMMKGAAEFYRNFPNLRQGADGKYHIHHVNSNESVYGARDTDEDMSAMRGILASAIRASEILQTDADLRAAWRTLLANLAPLPTSDDPEALRPADYQGPRVIVRGLKPAARGEGVGSDPNSLPSWFFDLCNLESDDPARLALCQATFDATLARGGIERSTPVGVLSKVGIAAATLGRADAVRYLVPNQMRILDAERPGAYKQGRLLANRLSLREGHHAPDAQFLGRASQALEMALLQSNPPFPGGDPVLRLFPAWPRTWDAAFKLAARGAFIVQASITSGEIGPVTIESRAGARCRLRNPWGPQATVSVRRSGGGVERQRGDPLNFATGKEETLVIERSVATDPVTPKTRVLVVTGGHDFEEQPFFQVFEDNRDIVFRNVKHPDAHAFLTRAAAADYDVVVLYDLWPSITADAAAEFSRVLAAGKGLVALHHSLCGYQDWNEYRQIIGGRYYLKDEIVAGRAWKASTYKHDERINVRVADPRHPVTRGVRDFEIRDEVYGGYEVLPDSRALLATDHPANSPTLAWWRTWGQARVVYLQLGHDRQAYENASFRRLLANAIAWAAGGD